MLSLKHFLLQQRVLRLYRRAIRAARSIPDPRTRAETTLWFRADIERNRHLADTATIEHQLNVVDREIRQVFPGTSADKFETHQKRTD